MLDIHVIYKTPSKESLFLGDGWGAVRDVRGPYLLTSAAEIVIGNWALSSKMPSTVYLTLAVSNRCAVDALFVRATGIFGAVQILVKKNEEAVLTIPDLFTDRSRLNTVITVRPTFGASDAIGASAGSVDIVAINELRLTR